MFLRKFRSIAIIAQKHKHSLKTHKSHTRLVYFYTFISSILIFLLFVSCFNSHHNAHLTSMGMETKVARTVVSQPLYECKGVSVYVYDLPAKFNFQMLDDCSHLNVYTNMCPHVANRGLGRPLSNTASRSSQSWFATHQFIGEMIFHARMENHPCRTSKPEYATLFYVPFYGGLHASSKFREGDLVERDRLAVELVNYLSYDNKWWARNHGKDHFLALGRTSWDFMRAEAGPDFGANSLLVMPRVKNMSMLTVERNPWQGSNQYGIPYPSYFHPSDSKEILIWQEKVQLAARPYLFSFVGAPRKNIEKAAVRDEILRQCMESDRCETLLCTGPDNKCHDPDAVLEVMTRSEFCMQAPGDSFTRRSTFDSILAGCIPVFFSPHTAYTQYGWYLPKDTSSFSVYMKEEHTKAKSIEEVLLKISRENVESMRKNVINLIPRVTYNHPNATTFGVKDAADIALEELSKHVKSTLFAAA